MCDHLETFQLFVITFEVMCDKFSVKCPLPRTPVFDPKAVHVELWWTEWLALGLAFLRVLRLSPARIVAPVLHTPSSCTS